MLVQEHGERWLHRLRRRRTQSPWCFFLHDPATPEIYTRPYTLSLHDALPICTSSSLSCPLTLGRRSYTDGTDGPRSEEHTSELQSHGLISYAVFCLKKKNTNYLHGHAANTSRLTHRRYRI